MRIFNHRFWRLRISTNRRLAMAENMRLFPADFFACITKIRRVINTDAAQDGTIRINRVHRIETTAQPNFQNHSVKMCLLEDAQNRQSRKFKIRKRFIAAGLLDFLKRFDKRVIVDFVSCNHATFVKTQQMRRRMHTHAISRVTQDRFQQSTSATFSVGACHGKHRASKLDSHASNHVFHALETEIHGFFMDFADVVKPVIETGLLPGSSKSCCIGH